MNKHGTHCAIKIRDRRVGRREKGERGEMREGERGREREREM